MNPYRVVEIVECEACGHPMLDNAGRPTHSEPCCSELTVRLWLRMRMRALRLYFLACER